MRSHLRKTKRSRISLLDRVVNSHQKKKRILAQSQPKGQDSLAQTIHPTPDSNPDLTPDPSIGPPTPRSKKRFFWHAMIDRLQQPVGIRPVFLLILTWLLMLVIIWGACQEIISLGAPNQPKQSVIQIEQKAVLELLAALVIGGVGLSLILTPTLKHQAKSDTHPPIARELEASKD